MSSVLRDLRAPNKCLTVKNKPLTAVINPCMVVFNTNAILHFYNITNILHNPDIARQTNAKGIKTFQHSVNSWSARKRGSVQRIHICTPTIVSDFNNVHAIPHPNPVVQSARRKLPMLGNGLFHPPKKITTPNIATRNIIAYSARNKKANLIPPYSV